MVEDGDPTSHGTGDTSRERSEEGGPGDESRSSRRGECRGGRHRRSRRRHRGSGPGRRKERVLHTRISEELSDDIRRLADDMRVPVSNLVRNVLEEVFTAVEQVTGDVGDFFDEVLDEAEGVRDRIHQRRRRPESGSPAPKADPEPEFEQDEAAEAREGETLRQADATRPDLSHILGWQPVIANRASSCKACRTAIEPADHAFIGLEDSGHSRDLYCEECASV
jgi:hypothetical protein